MTEVDWQAVEAVGTCVGVMVLVGAAWFAWRKELPELKRSRHAQAAMDIYRELRSCDQIEGLRKIYELEGEEVPSDMEAQAGRVLDRFDLLGAMVVTGEVDEEMAFRLVRGGPLRCWYKLREYISKQRERRGHFARYFEYYAHRSVKYQYENVAREEWTRLNGKNLVEELKGLLPEREPPK